MELDDPLHFSNPANRSQRLTPICTTVILIAAELSLLIVCSKQQETKRKRALEVTAVMVSQVLEDSSCTNVTRPAAKFWFIALVCHCCKADEDG